MMKIRLEQIQQARRIHGGWVNLVTAATGVKLSRMRIPRRFRRSLYQKIYGSKYGALNEKELGRPLETFASINELFTRAVPAEQRPIFDDERVLLSPCDGTVQDAGVIDDETTLTVKETDYSLSKLTDIDDCSFLRDGFYSVLFLSPRDCHRIFCPAQSRLVRVTHVPGYRLLVHPPFQRKEYPVFTLNERVVLEFQSERFGRFLLVMVAGWGVGHITHPFPVRYHRSSRRPTHYRLETPRSMAAGDWVATFELGSTVVMLTKQLPRHQLNVMAENTIHYGQPLIGEGMATPKTSETSKPAVSVL